ncbi:hypothetical protein JOQ06_015442, partial [Pogonophryne albipinna]
MLAEWSTGGSIELWPETGRQYLDLSRPPPFLSLIFITSTDWSSNKKEPDAVAHTLKHILDVLILCDGEKPSDDADCFQITGGEIV